MDIPVLSTPTQMILAWTMLAILLGWLIIFAALALRPQPNPELDKLELWDEQPTPARSFPAVTVQVGQQHPFS
jgi:hypothetical protein